MALKTVHFLATFLIFCRWADLAKALDVHCDSDHCYSSLNTSFENLHQKSEKLLKLPIPIIPSKPDLSNITELAKRNEKVRFMIDDIYKQLNEKVDDLHEKIKDSAKARTALHDISRNLEQIKNKADMSFVVNIFQGHLNFFEEAVKNKYAAFEACNDTLRFYNESEETVHILLENTKEVAELHSNNVLKSNEINRRLSETLLDIAQARNDFDSIKIPDGYLQISVDSTLEIIRELINLLEQDKNNLKTMIKDLLIDRPKVMDSLDEINKTVSQREEDVKSINKDISDYEQSIPKIDGTILTSEMIDLIKMTVNELDLLEQKIKLIREDFGKITGLILKAKEIVELTDMRRGELLDEINRLKSYVTLTNALLISEERQLEVKEQIATARKTMELIKTKREVQKEFEDVKRIYDELLSYKKEEICVNDVQFEN